MALLRPVNKLNSNLLRYLQVLWSLFSIFLGLLYEYVMLHHVNLTILTPPNSLFNYFNIETIHAFIYCLEFFIYLENTKFLFPKYDFNYFITASLYLTLLLLVFLNVFFSYFLITIIIVSH